MEHAIIVGAGLVGSLLSVYLARANFKVSIFERNSDPSQINLQVGKSINITLCERGFQALDAVGVGNVVRKLCIPLYGRIIHSQDGQCTYQPYGNNQEAIYAIKREDLSQVLLDFSQKQENIDFYFQQKCIDIDLQTTTLKFQQLNTGAITKVQAQRIFAADGAYSAIRQKMQRLKRFNYSQEYLEQGYREIIIPSNRERSWLLEKNAIHIWPRDNFMLIGFPNLDGSFSLSLHLPYVGRISHESIKTHEDIQKLFETYFSDILPLVKSSLQDYCMKPIGDMITIKCFPWTYQDKAALIGDACHAIFPYYGQGANAGFEDCQILIQCMEKYPGDWQTILQEYEKSRKPNTDAIAHLCSEHFRILRKLVGDPNFLLRKKIERKIQKMYPEYSSLYHNITFTCMPYAEALRVEQKNRAVIDKIVAIDDVEEKLDTPEIGLLISKLVRNVKAPVLARV
ncbi:MAG: FAD-dependent monooxygenase [Symploca sp. SIO1C4]|uniref:FAD-dependent monooxygenase n=1 Tax=Symploca sp. SIO1C4 TaxID=2607765 RepID=A0A6B3N9E6_9CYAN|nr:FAD-dependent monooxygenase [Symploca sp. SIO1C4]